MNADTSQRVPIVPHPIDSAALLTQVSQVWAQVVEATPASIREAVSNAVQRKAERIALTFYDFMLAQDNAAMFLSNEIVKARLNEEMQRWLCTLFPPAESQSVVAQAAHQVAIGAVHARIKLPVELMNIGGHVLSREVVRHVQGALANSEQRPAATYYVMAMFSFASGLILSAFVREMERSARGEEAYRQLLYRSDAVLERERQRAALSEWAQRCLTALASPSRRASIVPLGKSEFARWVNHKGRALFESAAEFAQVRTNMEHIDLAILPRLIAGGLNEDAYSALIDDLDSRLEFMRYALNDLFERVTRDDAGRDVITHLLNRRYLPSILAREVNAHASGGQPFTLSLLRVLSFATNGFAVDSDQAKNDFLQRVAVELTQHAGAGDHVFRYTDNDFLILEVDSTLARSMERGKRLIQKLESFLNAGGQAHSDATLRMVVALADGHPDYQRILRRVEFAIASRTGQNEVVAA